MSSGQKKPFGIYMRVKLKIGRVSFHGVCDTVARENDRASKMKGCVHASYSCRRISLRQARPIAQHYFSQRFKGFPAPLK